MKYLFKTIPTSLPPKKIDDYKKKYQTTTKEVFGKLYTENINSMLPPI